MKIKANVPITEYRQVEIDLKQITVELEKAMLRKLRQDDHNHWYIQDGVVYADSDYYGRVKRGIASSEMVKDYEAIQRVINIIRR